MGSGRLWKTCNYYRARALNGRCIGRLVASLPPGVDIFMKLERCYHRIARKISPAALPILLGVAALAQSPQASKSKDPLERESPQSSVYAFLQACQAHDYEKAAKYLDIRKLPPDQRLKTGPALAQQLQQILDRDAQFDVANLSQDLEGSRASGLPPNRERVTFHGERPDARSRT
jgi:hypothetical protein